MEERKKVSPPEAGTVFERIADGRRFRVINTLSQDESYWYVNALPVEGAADSELLDIESIYGNSPRFKLVS